MLYGAAFAFASHVVLDKLLQRRKSGLYVEGALEACLAVGMTGMCTFWYLELDLPFGGGDYVIYLLAGSMAYVCNPNPEGIPVEIRAR
jgi:hypothetical protein